MKRKILSVVLILCMVLSVAPIGNGVRSGSSYTGNAFKGTFDGGSITGGGVLIDCCIQAMDHPEEWRFI